MSSIPRKEIQAAATNPSERGFPTTGTPVPDDGDAWSAPNNPVSKTPAEKNKAWEGKTLNGRGAGTTGGRGRELLQEAGQGEGEGGEGAVGHGGPAGGEEIRKKLSAEEWENQEAQLGQGAKEAPAGMSGTS
jgi:hypothetical protein